MIPVLGHEHSCCLYIGAKFPIQDLVIAVLDSTVLVIILSPVHVINISSLHTRTVRSLSTSCWYSPASSSILESHNDITHVVEDVTQVVQHCAVSASSDPILQLLWTRNCFTVASH